MSKARIKYEGSKIVIFWERSFANNLGEEVQGILQSLTEDYGT